MREQLSAGMRHPATHYRREIKPVSIFQGVNQGARNLVVANGGARPLVGWRIGDGFHGEQPGSTVEWKGNTEPFAVWRRDEGEFGPASRTQAGTVDGLATRGTKLRQGDVEGEPQCAAQGSGQPGKPNASPLGGSHVSADFPNHGPTLARPLGNLNQHGRRRRVRALSWPDDRVRIAGWWLGRHIL